LNKFTSSEIKKLKFYVYVYSHPISNEIFYVGKGKGNRAFSHLVDDSENQKVKYISDLKQQGLEPKIEILSHGIENGETALKVESAIIDLIGINNLTNKQKGFKSATLGRMTLQQIKSAYSKQIINITEPAILIRINQAFRYSMTPMELYDYTRGHWVLNPANAGKAKYAFSIYEGIIQEIYEIAGWFKAGTTYSVRENNEYVEREAGDKSENRYEFVGNLASQNVRDKYKFKSIGDIFKKGNSNPIMYKNLPT
jgi:uncharacterized protein